MIWSADFFLDATLVTVGIDITNLGYLKDRSSRSMKLPDSGIEKLNKILVELDTAAVILEINDQDPTDLIDSEAKWVNKKKEKARKRWQKKVNLV